MQVPMIDEVVEDCSLLPSKQELYNSIMMMMVVVGVVMTIVASVTTPPLPPTPHPPLVSSPQSQVLM